MKIMLQRYCTDSKAWLDTGERFSTVADADSFLRGVQSHPHRVRWEDGSPVALVTKGTAGGVFGRLEGASPFADPSPGEPLPPGQHWACGLLTRAESGVDVLVYDAPFATLAEAARMAKQRQAEKGRPGVLFVPLRVVPLSDGSAEVCVVNPTSGRRFGLWRKPLPSRQPGDGEACDLTLPAGERWAVGRLEASQDAHTAEARLSLRVLDSPLPSLAAALGAREQRAREDSAPGVTFLLLRVKVDVAGQEWACACGDDGFTVGRWVKPLPVDDAFRFAVWTTQQDGRECSPVDRRPTVERAAELGRRVVERSSDPAARVGIFDTEAKRWVTRDLCGEFGPRREG